MIRSWLTLTLAAALLSAAEFPAPAMDIPTPEKKQSASAVFFSIAHDPTQLNRQGLDEGTQYRSAIFYVADEEKRVAEAYIRQLNDAKVFRRPIVTQVVQLNGFYAAEDYHQDYIAHNPNDPYVVYSDLPKLKRLKQQYPELLK